MMKINANIMQKEESFTIKIILMDVFQCLVDEVHAPQSLWRQRNNII